MLHSGFMNLRTKYQFFIIQVDDCLIRDNEMICYKIICFIEWFVSQFTAIFKPGI